jgi:tripartite-type tricarboxylate transporter receptor subunit TctC
MAGSRNTGQGPSTKKLKDKNLKVRVVFIPMQRDQLSSSLADIRAGKLKALATIASQRLAELPEVPTARELGFAVLEADGWNGLFVPAKTPREVIERLHREAVSAVKHPETSRRLRDMGAEPIGSTPAEQEAILKRQMDQFRPVIREMKVEN